MPIDKHTLHIYIVITTLLITPLFFTLAMGNAEARGGACSNHRGVNCAAGADRDGSVICNDGNKNSTVPYAAMAVCHNTHHVMTGEPRPKPTQQSTQQQTTCRKGFKFDAAKKRCIRK